MNLKICNPNDLKIQQNIIKEIKKWENDDWWDWYKERDYTILSTREENRKEKDFHKIKKIEIPLEKNLFLGKRVGFVYGDAEKHFLRNISHKLDEIKL